MKRFEYFSKMSMLGVNKLNALGRDGWQLVATKGLWAYFMREIEPPRPERAKLPDLPAPEVAALLSRWTTIHLHDQRAKDDLLADTQEALRKLGVWTPGQRDAMGSGSVQI